MKKILLIIVAVLSVFVVCGCGKKEDLSEYVGEYEGVYSKFVGDPDDVIEEDPFRLVLKDDKTGTSYRDDAEYRVTWSVKDGEFTMQEKFAGMTIDYNGGFDGEEFVLYNGDKENPFTYKYVYKKK